MDGDADDCCVLDEAKKTHRISQLYLIVPMYVKVRSRPGVGIEPVLRSLSATTPTGRSNWILHRKWKYDIWCLRDVILRIEKEISLTA